MVLKNEMIYYNRHIDSELKKWRQGDLHKPVLLHGARQTGKSSAVRNLAKSFEFFIEINFEENKTVREVFEKSDLTPQLLCENA